MAKVYFIGAGPGDPELITLKAVKIISQADVIIYAGSTINQEILRYAQKAAQIHNSAGLNLEEILDLIKAAVKQGKIVARLHSGDPALYGATGEQMELLTREGIPFEVIPGVSSFLAAAAALKKELTIPEVAQTVIITRLTGRTGVPEKESLSSLAKHQGSMCIFLSVHQMEKVVAELKEGFPPDTPVVVMEKVSWPKEKIIFGNLNSITQLVKAEKIEKTALILVGDFLKTGLNKHSKLYAKNFSHGFRRCK
ncbi:MAG: precorrin-4 C(11)-methyltransferase [Peptococcaceae bacterium]